jgi:hypothetical protein
VRFTDEVSRVCIGAGCKAAFKWTRSWNGQLARVRSEEAVGAAVLLENRASALSRDLSMRNA